MLSNKKSFPSLASISKNLKSYLAHPQSSQKLLYRLILNDIFSLPSALLDYNKPHNLDFPLLFTILRSRLKFCSVYDEVLIFCICHYRKSLLILWLFIFPAFTFIWSLLSSWHIQERWVWVSSFFLAWILYPSSLRS